MKTLERKAIKKDELKEIAQEYQYMQVDLENLEDRITDMIEGLKLVEKLRDRLEKHREELEAKKSKDSFTVEELLKIRAEESALLQWELLIAELSAKVRDLEERIVKAIPKINKEKFKVELPKYVLEIKNGNLISISNK